MNKNLSKLLSSLLIFYGLSNAQANVVETNNQDLSTEGEAESLSLSTSKIILKHLVERLPESELRNDLRFLQESGGINELTDSEVKRFNRQLLQLAGGEGRDSGDVI